MNIVTYFFRIMLHYLKLAVCWTNSLKMRCECTLACNINLRGCVNDTLHTVPRVSCLLCDRPPAALGHVEVDVYAQIPTLSRGSCGLHRSTSSFLFHYVRMSACYQRFLSACPFPSFLFFFPGGFSQSFTFNFTTWK